MPTKTASSFSRQASRKDPESLTALPKPRAAYRSGAESKEKILTQCKNVRNSIYCFLLEQGALVGDSTEGKESSYPRLPH